MHRPQEQIRALHAVFGQPMSPQLPALRNPALRARLVLEEALEAAVALAGSADAIVALKDVLAAGKDISIDHDGEIFVLRNKPPNLLNSIHEIIDVLVVAYGTLEDIGVDGEPFFDEVHRVNLAKADGPVSETGKRLKPPGWQPAQLRPILDNMIATIAVKSTVTDGNQGGSDALS